MSVYILPSMTLDQDTASHSFYKALNKPGAIQKTPAKSTT